MTDWNKLKEEMGPKFKPYATDGDYKVKVAEAEVHEVGSKGSVAIDIKFEEAEDVQYPKATHWMSERNVNWTKWHSKCLLEVLGVPTASAEKAIDACEAKRGDRNALIEAYKQTFAKAAQKHKEVEIEVFTETNQTNGKDYARAEFKDSSVAMPHDSKPQTESTMEEAIEDSEELSLDDIPFGD